MAVGDMPMQRVRLAAPGIGDEVDDMRVGQRLGDALGLGKVDAARDALIRR